jgi:hypothetical protein
MRSDSRGAPRALPALILLVGAVAHGAPARTLSLEAQLGAGTPIGYAGGGVAWHAVPDHLSAALAVGFDGDVQTALEVRGGFAPMHDLRYGGSVGLSGGPYAYSECSPFVTGLDDCFGDYGPTTFEFDLVLWLNAGAYLEVGGADPSGRSPRLRLVVGLATRVASSGQTVPGDSRRWVPYTGIGMSFDVL